MTATVFLSHASADREMAQKIVADLEARSIRCWIPSRDVAPGEHFGDASTRALRAARVVILVFSRHSDQSLDVKKEIFLAEQAGITVIPLRVEDVAPSGALLYQLAMRQWIDLFGDWPSGIDRLATQIENSCAVVEPQPAPPAPASASASASTPEHVRRAKQPRQETFYLARPKPSPNPHAGPLKTSADHRTKSESGALKRDERLSHAPSVVPNDTQSHDETGGGGNPPGQQDHVSFAASHPKAVQSDTPFLTKIWVFPQDQYDQARARAQEETNEPVRFNAQGAQIIARQTRLTLRLSIEHCTISPEVNELIWGGQIISAGFQATPDAFIGEGASLPGTARIEVEGLRIAEIRFNIMVGSAPGSGFSTANAIRKAFISYASRDRWLVLGRVQGIQKAGIDVFMDVHSLFSNDRYEEKLFEQIEQADRLYLFWSRRAKRSQYVEREWRHGLQHKGLDFIDPVPLTDPRRTPPPPELAGEKHFNDWILFYERYERSLNLRARLFHMLLQP
jgi:hypothetical protein